MIHEVLPDSSSMEAYSQVQPIEYVSALVKKTAAKSDLQYRVFDLFFVLFAAPIVLPVLAIIAILVKLDDPKSPIFYRQIRYGKNEVPFHILKVRTMVPDADAMKATLIVQSEDQGPGFKLDDDPRVTRLGRTLRKLYLDELPQFWNVFRGEMAIVGPRANSANPAELEPWQRLRLAVRPGMTGSWQTMRNKPRDFNERCRIDLEYIAKKSLLADIGVIFRTIMVVARPTGC